MALSKIAGAAHLRSRLLRSVRRQLLVAAAWMGVTFMPVAAFSDDLCEIRQFDGGGYVVCSIQRDAPGLKLFWQDGESKPYRTFSRLAAATETAGETLKFAINAGMYGEDFAPVGLHVENGETLHPLNTADVTPRRGNIPNFYKKPNGIFFMTEEGANILTTDAFLERQPDVRFATQSGPMLVIDGKLHPAFIEGSSARNRRSGVGICEDGRVHFAVSQRAVNFDEFARFFRDELKCANALFLDGGNGTGFYNPSLRRNDWSGHGGYGPMIGYVEPSKE